MYWFLLVWFGVGVVFGQQPHVAVIDFTGDKNLSVEQLQFIAGKMAAELVATQEFVVLDRSRMDYILQEQGFQQTGACDAAECRVQVGQLLGVDKLVAGNLVRFGTTYMLRLDYLDVGSGRIEKSVDLQGEGELQQLMGDLCEQGARKLALSVSPRVQEELQPPRSGVSPQNTSPSRPLSLKRKIALAMWGSSFASAGGGYYFDVQGEGALNDYNRAHLLQDAEGLRAAAENMDKDAVRRNAGYGAAAGTALVGLALWFWPD